MYSKNDYRYYLERRLDSTDYIAHARSHKYIKKIGDRYFYTQQEIAAFMGKDKKRSESVVGNSVRGGDVTESIAKQSRPASYFIARNNMLDAQTKGKRLTAKTKAQPTIKADQDRGRKRTESLKKTVDYDYKDTRTVTPKKRKTLKGRVANIRRKYGLYREKPKGKSLGGGITVTHDVKVRDKKVPDKIEYDKIEYDKKVRRR